MIGFCYLHLLLNLPTPHHYKNHKHNECYTPNLKKEPARKANDFEYVLFNIEAAFQDIKIRSKTCGKWRSQLILFMKFYIKQKCLTMQKNNYAPPLLLSQLEQNETRPCVFFMKIHMFHEDNKWESIIKKKVKILDIKKQIY